MFFFNSIQSHGCTADDAHDEYTFVVCAINVLYKIKYEAYDIKNERKKKFVTKPNQTKQANTCMLHITKLWKHTCTK